MTTGDINKTLEHLVCDQRKARLLFHRGDDLDEIIFSVTSYEEGVGLAVSHDKAVVIQFVVEDLASVSLHTG